MPIEKKGSNFNQDRDRKKRQEERAKQPKAYSVTKKPLNLPKKKQGGSVGFKYGTGGSTKPVNDFFEKMKCGGLTKK